MLALPFSTSTTPRTCLYISLTNISSTSVKVCDLWKISIIEEKWTNANKYLKIELACFSTFHSFSSMKIHHWPLHRTTNWPSRMVNQIDGQVNKHWSWNEALACFMFVNLKGQINEFFFPEIKNYTHDFCQGLNLASILLLLPSFMIRRALDKLHIHLLIDNMQIPL